MTPMGLHWAFSPARGYKNNIYDSNTLYEICAHTEVPYTANITTSCCDSGLCQRDSAAMMRLLGLELELWHLSWQGWSRHFCSPLERQSTLLPKAFARKQSPKSRCPCATCGHCLCADMAHDWWDMESSLWGQVLLLCCGLWCENELPLFFILVVSGSICKSQIQHWPSCDISFFTFLMMLQVVKC